MKRFSWALCSVIVPTLALAQPSRPAARPAPQPAAQPARPAATPAPPRPAAASPNAAANTAAATTPPSATPGNAPGQRVTAPASEPAALEIARRIQEFYDRTNDFQADFVQVSRNRLYGEDRRTGSVQFRKPGRMRWNYNAPSGDIIVSDGTTLWAYQAEERQAVQQRLAESQLPTALTFLAGTGRLTDSFTFRQLDATQFRFPQGIVLELRPTTPQPTYERIVFYVDRNSYQVVRTAVIDAQGNQNRFDFSNPRVNMNLAESTFRWTPPAGTNIIRP
ncbi:MAG: outer membrane lipoprotein carrier protein LolA [Myxococcales bacterium]|nr:outer membrane lipoprotein carrier protein LolA [Myxococcales bacterium]